MSYEQFKDMLQRDLKKYLPSKYESWQLQIREIPKINGYLEGIHLMPEGDGHETPTIYVQDLYQYYLKCKSEEQVCQRAASIFVMGMDYAKRLRSESCLNLSRDNIVYCLINAEENHRLLEDVPHRMTLDLALIYRIMIHEEESGFNSAIITYDLAEEMGLNEEELFALAEENTPRILPAKIHYCEDQLAILTNEYKLLGAAALLYPGLLQRVAEELEGDLLILPSSIHEAFLVPAIGQDLGQMNRAVIEANNTIVRPEDVLAQHIYFYDYDADTVGIPVE